VADAPYPTINCNRGKKEPKFSAAVECGFRGDRARHSELMARSVPRIMRAAFRFDGAQFEVGLA
jgi:hypothetical protein